MMRGGGGGGEWGEERERSLGIVSGTSCAYTSGDDASLRGGTYRTTAA